MDYLDTNIKTGEPKMIVEDMGMSFLFGDRKVFQCIRKPTTEELENLPEVEMAAPASYNPSGSTHLQPQRKNIKKDVSKISIEEWRKRLVLAPDDTINHALDNTTQHN